MGIRRDGCTNEARAFHKVGYGMALGWYSFDSNLFSILVGWLDCSVGGPSYDLFSLYCQMKGSGVGIASVLVIWIV